MIYRGYVKDKNTSKSPQKLGEYLITFYLIIQSLFEKALINCELCTFPTESKSDVRKSFFHRS